MIKRYCLQCGEDALVKEREGKLVCGRCGGELSPKVDVVVYVGVKEGKYIK